MFYAITITDGGLITGRHESGTPISAEVFAHNPSYAGQRVREIAADDAFTAGHWLGEYDDNNRLKPLVERINDGYAQVPNGFELIDGELVAANMPETEAPPSLIERIERAETAHALEASAAKVIFIAMAQAGTVSKEQALEHQGLFPTWAERLGETASVGSYWQHEGGLYRVKTAHTLSAQWAPGLATAALFERVQPEGTVEAWKPGQGYAKGVHVMHQGKTWESMVANNVWEPGASGVHETIWKEVKE